VSVLSPEASPDEAQRQLAQVVKAQIGNWADFVQTVVRANTGAQSAGGILDRPDVAMALDGALAGARQQAEQAVTDAWERGGGAADSPYLSSLLADVDRAYSQAPGEIRQAAVSAFAGVPRALSRYEGGSALNVPVETAQARAAAVRQAVAHTGASLLLRNSLSADVARAASETDAVIAEALQRRAAGERVGLQWVSRLDPHTCPWCRMLHGTIVEPGEQFPHGGVIGRHRPPKVYRGVLLGPPRHPRCRCRPRIVVLGSPAPPPAPPAPGMPPGRYISSDDIRALPEERYQSLVSFLMSALAQLGRILRALLGLGG
jgi:Phage Mu protein F like protein